MADYDTVASIRARLGKIVFSAKFRFTKRKHHLQTWFPRDLVSYLEMKHAGVHVKRRLVGSPAEDRNIEIIKRALKYVMFKSVTVELEKSKEKAVNECVETVVSYIHHKSKEFLRTKRVQRIREEEERKRDRKDALNNLESSLRELMNRYEYLKEADVLRAFRQAKKKQTVEKVMKA